MKIPRLNATWHKKHKMPKNPSPAERLKWHRAHAKQCGCWPMPEALKRNQTRN